MGERRVARPEGRGSGLPRPEPDDANRTSEGTATRTGLSRSANVDIGPLEPHKERPFRRWPYLCRLSPRLLVFLWGDGKNRRVWSGLRELLRLPCVLGSRFDVCGWGQGPDPQR